MTRPLMQIERRRQQDHDGSDDVYARLSPGERLGVMWQLAVDAWAFAGHDVSQSRLSRHLVVLQRRAR